MIVKQAADWHAWMDTGEDSVEKQTEFAAWMVADARHGKAFAEIERAWTQLDALARIAGPERVADAMSPARRWPFAAAFAAFVLAAIIIVKPLDYFYWTVLRADHGEAINLSLSDGSRVVLNTGAELRVRMTREARDLRLSRGEAVFSVAHDKNRPFTVKARNVRVTAVGTLFSLKVAGEDNVDVALKEGIVDLESSPSLLSRLDGAHAVLQKLKAGQIATAGPHDIQVRDTQGDEMLDRLSWARLRFYGNPLTVAVDEINRYNDMKLQIDDPAIASLPVGGIYPANDPRVLVQALKVLYGLQAIDVTDPETEFSTIHLIGPKTRWNPTEQR